MIGFVLVGSFVGTVNVFSSFTNTTQSSYQESYHHDCSKNFEAETPLPPLHSTTDNGVEAKTYYYELRDDKYILGASKMTTTFDHSPTILIFTNFRNFTITNKHD